MNIKHIIAEEKNIDGKTYEIILTEDGKVYEMVDGIVKAEFQSDIDWMKNSYKLIKTKEEVEFKTIAIGMYASSEYSLEGDMRAKTEALADALSGIRTINYKF